MKVYQANGIPAEEGGRGLFTEAFCKRHPELPVEEEGRLCDPVLRENFLTRVFACARWRALCASGLTRRGILEFHARYKYQLMAHDPQQYHALGRLLGDIGKHAPEKFGPPYFRQLMAALARCATRGTHSNVLQHISGYLKGSLGRDEKAEMQRLIEQYRNGIVPLVVPLTLLKHHFARHPDPYIAQQAYLQPHRRPQPAQRHLAMDEHDDTPLDGDFQEALARGLLPIRDVSRLTGVNPVTLRAWERRYGLVLPQRTAKGHRLYAPEHVARIRAVLTWLDRGVPVGQVKGLLRGGQHAALAPRRCGTSSATSCWKPSPPWPNGASTNASTQRYRSTRRSPSACSCCCPCSRRWKSAGAMPTARAWSGCSSTPGCAASWGPHLPQQPPAWRCPCCC